MFPYLDHVHFEATCSCIRLVAAMVPCHAQALFLVQQPIMTLHAWFLISIHKVLCPCAKSSHCTRHCTLVPLSGGGDYIAPCAIQGHGLHATTCHVANDANKACPMCLAHVWGLTLKPLSVATPMPPYLPQVTKVPLPPFFLKSILGHFGGDIIHTWEGIMNFN